jgi:hypothetical protein
MMQNVLSILDKMDKAHNPASKGKKGWDYSPIEGEWTHLVGEYMACLGSWFLS